MATATNMASKLLAVPAIRSPLKKSLIPDVKATPGTSGSIEPTTIMFKLCPRFNLTSKTAASVATSEDTKLPKKGVFDSFSIY